MCPFCGWFGWGWMWPGGMFFGLLWMVLWIVVIVAGIYLVLKMVGGWSEPRHRHLEDELRALRKELEELRKHRPAN